MSERHMKCPECKNESAEMIYEEVDIGVGVQRFAIGCECPQCGLHTIACNWCGGWDCEPPCVCKDKMLKLGDGYL